MVDGPEVEIFKDACKKNGISLIRLGYLSLTGEENPSGPTPSNTRILIFPTGSNDLPYRKIFPGVPQEPWTPGTTTVAVGPKDLIIGAPICYDMNLPELVRDTVSKSFKGAEHMIRIQNYMHHSKEQQIAVA
ncbi:hypothetical protein HK097_010437 [Rhizophlyctis rosea]|uniref:CN hydrolase domain-containing protein n=1 Tax=Rhizophlyctis rosea TaxID=64517 RepID=A0AAD5X0G7_9FUNG|nr:hypothetical protein HK097_010437 [Rhizophlyctis rosea]